MIRPTTTMYRGRDADGRIARRDRDQQQADRHHAERDDQAAPAAEMVDVGAQHDGAQGAHEEARRRKCRATASARQTASLFGEKSAADIGRVIGVDHEVVHFEEVAARHADDCRRERAAIPACDPTGRSRDLIHSIVGFLPSERSFIRASALAPPATFIVNLTRKGGKATRHPSPPVVKLPYFRRAHAPNLSFSACQRDRRRTDAGRGTGVGRSQRVERSRSRDPARATCHSSRNPSDGLQPYHHRIRITSPAPHAAGPRSAEDQRNRRLASQPPAGPQSRA